MIDAIDYTQHGNILQFISLVIPQFTQLLKQVFANSADGILSLIGG